MAMLIITRPGKWYDYEWNLNISTNNFDPQKSPNCLKTKVVFQATRMAGYILVGGMVLRIWKKNTSHGETVRMFALHVEYHRIDLRGFFRVSISFYHQSKKGLLLWIFPEKPIPHLKQHHLNGMKIHVLALTRRASRPNANPWLRNSLNSSFFEGAH